MQFCSESSWFFGSWSGVPCALSSYRYEPFLPQLQPLATIGGVMVIKGKEGLGTHELAKLLGQIGV